MEKSATHIMNLLAYKLGVAVPHLWGVLVKQVYGESIIDAVMIGMGIVFLIVNAICLYYLFKRHDNDDESVITTCVFLGIAVTIIVVISLPGTIMGIINPENYALANLLDMLKH